MGEPVTEPYEQRQDRRRSSGRPREEVFLQNIYLRGPAFDPTLDEDRRPISRSEADTQQKQQAGSLLPKLLRRQTAIVPPNLSGIRAYKWYVRGLTAPKADRSQFYSFSMRRLTTSLSMIRSDWSRRSRISDVPVRGRRAD